MGISISVPDHQVYAADEAMPDRPVGLDLADAAYHAVHGSKGGAAALAARMGMPVETLTAKVNTNNTTHFLRPLELQAVMYFSGDAGPLHAMAAHLGYTCTHATPDQSGGDPVEAFMRLQVAHADLVRAVADPLAHGGDVNKNEMRRAEAMAAELQAVIGHTLAALRGRMRKAPEVGY
jgi:hypothetical protein